MIGVDVERGLGEVLSEAFDGLDYSTSFQFDDRPVVLVSEYSPADGVNGAYGGIRLFLFEVGTEATRSGVTE